MGFFSSLFGSSEPTNVEVVPDRIWLTPEAKFVGLSREVAEREQSDSIAVLLVAHFPDVLAHLDELAESRTSEVPVRAVLAENLNADLAASLRVDESVVVDIIAGERHPAGAADDRLKEFAAGLPCRCRLTHHVSLEDPVMQLFGGQWVQTILGQLGMTEDEAIQSEMVSRRLRQAQRKIGARVTGEFDAESAAEWLEKNGVGR